MEESSKRRYTIDDINAALAANTLTREQMITRMREAIAAEDARPEAERDRDLIMVYDSFLYQLLYKKPYVSRKLESKQAFMKEMNARTERKNRARPAMRVAISAAMVFVFLIALQSIFPMKWLYGTPSENNEQYIIQGGSIDHGLSAQGDEVSQTEEQSIETDNMTEIINFLGYEPSVPGYLPDLWALPSYRGFVLDGEKIFVAAFRKEGEESLLKYEENVFDSMERANLSIEQNEFGRYEMVDGKNVYFYRNYEMSGVVWVNNNICYSIYGPVSEDDLIKMINNWH